MYCSYIVENTNVKRLLGYQQSFSVNYDFLKNLFFLPLKFIHFIGEAEHKILF